MFHMYNKNNDSRYRYCDNNYNPSFNNLTDRLLIQVLEFLVKNKTKNKHRIELQTI